MLIIRGLDANLLAIPAGHHLVILSTVLDEMTEVSALGAVHNSRGCGRRHIWSIKRLDSYKGSTQLARKNDTTAILRFSTVVTAPNACLSVSLSEAMQQTHGVSTTVRLQRSLAIGMAAHRTALIE